MMTNQKINTASTMKTIPQMEKCNNVVHHILPEKLIMTPHLGRHSTIDLKPKCHQVSERRLRSIEHAHVFRKDNFLGKNIMEWGRVVVVEVYYISTSLKDN